MQSGVHRADGNVECLGDGPERKVKVVAQHEHHAMFDGQLREATLELIAVEETTEFVGRGGRERWNRITYLVTHTYTGAAGA